MAYTKDKTERLELRLTPTEKQQLVKRAKEAQLSLSAYILQELFNGV